MLQEIDQEQVKYVSKFSKVSFYQKYKNLIADNSKNVAPESFFKVDNKKATRKNTKRRTVYSSCAFGRRVSHQQPECKTPRLRLNTSVQKDRQDLGQRKSSICKTIRKVSTNFIIYE